MEQLSYKINNKKNQIIFSLCTKDYPPKAVLAASYVFLDRAYVFFNEDARKRKINICLEAKEKMGEKKLRSLKGEFLNELLNYLLREKINKQNKKIREYIVGRALLSSLPNELIGETLDESSEQNNDWQKDPLGIAVPWEEKYGKKSKGNKRNKNK